MGLGFSVPMFEFPFDVTGVGGVVVRAGHADEPYEHAVAHPNRDEKGREEAYNDI